MRENSIANLRLVYLRAVGGESASPATLAPKVGPLGMVFACSVAFDHVGPQEEDREGGKEEDVLRLHYRRCDGGYDQSAVLSKL